MGRGKKKKKKRGNLKPEGWRLGGMEGGRLQKLLDFRGSSIISGQIITDISGSKTAWSTWAEHACWKRGNWPRPQRTASCVNHSRPSPHGAENMIWALQADLLWEGAKMVSTLWRHTKWNHSHPPAQTISGASDGVSGENSILQHNQADTNSNIIQNTARHRGYSEM